MLRIYCLHGNHKRTCNAINANPKTIEHHIFVSRTKMGLRGQDIRLFLNWDKWVTQLELFYEHRT